MGIIDELVVEFSLDPTKFTKGQQELLDRLGETKDRVRKDSTEVERYTQNMADGFQSVVRAVGLLTAGYFTASSMTSFLQQTIQTNVAAHQLGVTLGVTAEKLGQYRQAARAAGVDPNSMIQTISSSTQALNSVSTGQAGANFWTSYSRLGVKGPLLDAAGKPIPVEDYLSRVQEAVRETQRSGRYTNGQITSFLADLGINSETAYVLEQTNRSLDRFLEEVRKTNGITNKGAAESQGLQESYGSLRNAIDQLAGAVRDDLNPGLEATLKWLKNIVEWFNEHRKTFETLAGIVAGATAGAALGTVIPGVGTVIGGVAGGIAGGIVGGTLPSRASTPSVPGAAPGSPVGNATLQRRRQSMRDEIQADPVLKQQLAGMMILEGAQDPVPVMESLANRTEYVNADRARRGLPALSLRQMLFSGFYGPINRGQLPGAMARIDRDSALRDRMYGAIDNVMNGSNVVRGATDQGMPSDPNGRWPGGRIYRGGNVYNDWGGGPGGHEGARLFREQQQQGLDGTAFDQRFGAWPTGQSGGAWPTPWLNNRSPFLSPGNTTHDNRRSSSISIGNISVATAAKNADDLVTGLDSLLKSRFSTVQSTSGLA